MFQADGDDCKYVKAMSETDYHSVTTTVQQGGSRRDGAKLVSENRILLMVCFVAVVLLGPMFMAGYLVGRKTASTEPQMQVPLEPPVPPSAATTRSAPTRPKTAALAKPAPEALAPEGASPNQPALHGTYLQLAATPRTQAVVERLRKNGFDAVALEIPAKPGVYRVLVGPLQEGTEAQIRTQLESKGLPGKAAIPRVF
ncbi:MAG TPA: SPOR domain-containing protein [Bryobacteraceae bacterium]|nr:SPOR domain-containing protein [Bryobacteraceae bacterium]